MMESTVRSMVSPFTNREDDEIPLLQSAASPSTRAISTHTDREEGPERNSVDFEASSPPSTRFVPRKVLVVSAAAVVFIFSLVIVAAVLTSVSDRFGGSKPPRWPKPSNSLLGEYSTAAVAADNVLCSEIGRDIMLQGGNAVDAAIATLFCIGVMDTQSAGLGGGHFMTIYNATTKRCHVVDAREQAPLAATEDMYKGHWNKSKFGWLAMGVPGELHGLYTEYSNFGSGNLEWAQLVQPTITLMEEGYPTSFALAASLKNFQKGVLSEPTMRTHFINPETGDLYKQGEQIVTRKNFIRTLKILANSRSPIDEFYRGDLTRSMVAEFKKYGGIITSEDFDRYESKVRKAEDIIYTRLTGGKIVCGPPPPSGSAVTAAVLNIMARLHFNLSTFDGNVELFHRFIESSKFAFAARSGLGDMDYVKNATEIARNITSEAWGNLMSKKITKFAQPDAYYGGNFLGVGPEDHGTSHISVIDKHGNAVSVTSTINLILGAMVMSESSGILWGDNMDDFSTPGHPNYYGYPPTPANFIRPGKRPMSSTSPLVIFHKEEGNKEVLTVGAAGGSTIITGVSGSVIHSLWFDRTVKEAIDRPRFHNQLRPNVTQYEEAWPKRYITALGERGHTFKKERHITVVTAVQRTKDGTIYANSDYRKGPESEPAGY